jgi:NAD+ kinase
MNFAIYGRAFNDNFIPHIQKLFDTLHDHGQTVLIYESFYIYLKPRIDIKSDFILFEKHTEIRENCKMVFSIGGDGTLLDTVNLVRDSKIPILGINTGRLGFLANIGKDDIEPAIEAVVAGKFKLEPRALLELKTSDNSIFQDFSVAMNELTVHKKDSSSMITIHTYINDNYLNSYWADGLIIATPTGSTAYSLSCGGPIIVPGSNNFVITPIAAHNLNVRPVVVADHNEIRLRVEGRSSQFLASLDSRSEPIDASVELKITKADFSVNLVVLERQNFLDTIRNKLMWGLDRRN